MPSSSRSMRAAAGFELSPGIVRMSPQIGYTKPAPTDARTSRTGRVQPVGAGFVYPICGDMRTMPGLSSNPAAARIDLDDDGMVVGLS